MPNADQGTNPDQGPHQCIVYCHSVTFSSVQDPSLRSPAQTFFSQSGDHSVIHKAQIVIPEIYTYRASQKSVSWIFKKQEYLRTMLEKRITDVSTEDRFAVLEKKMSDMEAHVKGLTQELVDL